MKKSWSKFLGILLLLIFILPAVYAQNVTVVSAEEILNEEITISPGLQIWARILFGFGEIITFKEAILRFIIWIMIFFILANFLNISLMFKGYKALAGAVTLTCIFALTGVLKLIGWILFGLAHIITRNSFWKLVIVTIIAIAFIWLSYNIAGRFEEKVVKKIEKEELAKQSAEEKKKV